MNFLEALYRHSESGYLTIWSLPDKATRFFKMPHEIKEAHEYALRKAADFDVYFGVGLRRSILDNGKRGSASDVCMLPAVFIDIDIADNQAHKKSDLPKSIEEAQNFLKNDLPLKPTYLVSSGHGLHAYWLLDEPFYITNEGERSAAQALLDGWNRYVNIRAQAHGWKFDSVGELARVLRVPGTLNHKCKPYRPVEILHDLNHPECSYPVSIFEEYYGGMAEGLSASDRELLANHKQFGDRFTLPDKISDGERNNTLFRLASSYRARGLGKDEIDALVKSANTERCSPPLGADELRTITSSVGRYPEGTAPSALALKAEEHLQPLIDGDLSAEDIIRDEIFDALFAIQDEVRRHMLYQKLLARARQLKVTRSFEGIYKARTDTEQAERRRQDAVNKTQSGIDLHLPDLPVEGFVMPNDWEIDPQGVRRYRMTKGEPVIEKACFHPILITAVYKNIETGLVKVRLEYYIDKKWHSKVVAASTIASKQTIPKLSDYGINGTSANAQHQVQFYSDFREANKERLRTIDSISRLGWIGADQFVPYNTDVIFDGEDTFKSMFDAVHSSGSKQKWLAAAQEASKDFRGRMMLAASFASPLMHQIGENLFIVHLWGRSGTGKTVALLLAESIWGNPKKLTKTFNSTKVGLERVAAFYYSIPLALDEYQTVMDKETVSTLLYQLTEGKGKSRGNKEGGLGEDTYWQCVIITNGEEPLNNHTADDGAKNRSIEIYVEDPLFCGRLSALCDVITDNYGHAGRDYITGIMTLQKDDPSAVKTKAREFRNLLAFHEQKLDEGKRHMDKQLNALSAMCAGYFFGRWFVFGDSEEAAQMGAEALLWEALAEFSTATQIDKVGAGFETIMGWIAANSQQFSSETTRGEMFGIKEIEDGKTLVYVIKHKLDDELCRHNFNPAQMVKGWLSRGWLAKVEGERSTVKKTVGGNRVRCYVFEMDEGYEDFVPVSDDDMPPEWKDQQQTF